MRLDKLMAGFSLRDLHLHGDDTAAHAKLARHVGGSGEAVALTYRAVCVKRYPRGGDLELDAVCKEVKHVSLTHVRRLEVCSVHAIYQPRLLLLGAVVDPRAVDRQLL